MLNKFLFYMLIYSGIRNRHQSYHSFERIDLEHVKQALYPLLFQVSSTYLTCYLYVAHGEFLF